MLEIMGKKIFTILRRKFLFVLTCEPSGILNTAQHTKACNRVAGHYKRNGDGSSREVDRRINAAHEVSCMHQVSQGKDQIPSYPHCL